MKLRILALCTVVLALAATTFAADGRSPMKPGKWSITIQMDMPGMAMPPMTFTRCVTQEQAERPAPPNTDDCKLSDYKLDGNTVTWSMKCEKQNMTGEGKITYNGDSYDGQGHMKVGDMDVTQKYSGKYLGDCDK